MSDVQKLEGDKYMSNDNTTIRLLCFDPALSCSGWAIIDYRPDRNTEVISRFGTIKPAQIAAKVAHKDEVSLFSKRTVSLALLREQVTALIEEHKPDYVIVEDSFFNPKRPNAYASLVQWTCVVAMLCRDVFNMPIFKIPTRSAKQCVTGTGGAGKVSVRQAILEDPEINFKQKRQAEGISKHESDAIAVGHCFIKEILPGILAGGGMTIVEEEELD